MLGSIFAIFSCYVLKNIRDPALRQAWSTIIGLLITFYTFGCTALVSLGMNLLCYLLFIIAPKEKLPLYIFGVGGLLLAMT